MLKQTFATTILTAGKTATGIEVPTEVVEALGHGKRPAVRVTINGYTYRSTVAVMGGKFMVGVSADVREKAGVAGGDKVNVTVELDTERRDVDVPADLAKALAKNKHAKAFFETLSFSRKRAICDSLEQAKTAETRARRIERSVSKLAENRT